MFIPELEPQPGTLARGDFSTFGDVYSAAVESGRKIDNILASVTQKEQAYDERIDAIEKATKIKLANPIREWQLPGLGPSRTQREAAFERRLSELAVQFPDHTTIIDASRPPVVVARERARKADVDLADVQSRYEGWSWVPGLLGGLRASIEDPANVAALLIGPTGRVGTGAKSVMWMGAKQGAANMAVETASQPIVQSWRREAGLDYGLSHAAMSVAVAGVFGFGADVGVRTGYRGVQSRLGRTPVLNDAGGVIGYRPRGAPEDALDAAARAAHTNSTIRKAADGDAEAIHQLARETGAAEDPAYRGARAAHELETELEAAHVPPRELGGDLVESGEGMARTAQSLRAALDPAEPMPRGVDPLPVGGAVAPGDLAVDTPRAHLLQGTGDAVKIAAELRKDHRPVDNTIPQQDDGVRYVRSLAALSDDAFAAVEAGHARADHGALVSDLVADRGLQAAILDEVTRAAPADARAARSVIGASLEARTVAAVQGHFAAPRIAPDVVAEHGAVANRLAPLLAQHAVLAPLGDAAPELIARLAARPGVVADIIADAARAGLAPKEAAERAAREIARRLDEDGLAAIDAPVVRPAAAQLDDPIGPEAKLQVERLEAGLKDALDDAKARRDGKPSRDDEVMFSIADRHGIDMSPEARKARAAAQGFDTSKVWYHGTPSKPFDAFDPKMFGRRDSFMGAGVYLSGKNTGGFKLAQADLVADPGVSVAEAVAQFNRLRAVAQKEFPRAITEETPSMQLRAILEREAQAFRARISGMGAEIRRLAFDLETAWQQMWKAQQFEHATKGDANGNVVGWATDQTGDGHTRELYVRINKPFRIDWSDPDATIARIREVFPEYQLTDASGQKKLGTMAGEARAFSAALMRAGYDAIDDWTSANHALIVLDPKNLRDVNAAFDPARTSDNGLMLSRAATDAALLKGDFTSQPRAAAEMAALRTAVEDAVKKVAPRDVRLNIQDRLTFQDRGADGFFDPAERMIHIALSATDPLRVGYEEAGHALKRAGLFTEQEYGLLATYAETRNLAKEYEIEKIYKPIYGKRWQGDEARIAAAYQEETIMKMLADHAAGRRFDSTVDRLLERVWKIIGAIREALGLRGYKSVHDVFAAFESGEIGGRREYGFAHFPTRIEDVPLDGPHPGPLLAYHGTFHAFDKMDKAKVSDFGLHFGTPAQAGARLGDIAEQALEAIERGQSAEAKRAAPDAPRTLPVVLGIYRPFEMMDHGNWHPKEMMIDLDAHGIKMTPVERQAIENFRVKADAYPFIERALLRAGYDGVRYRNIVEGSGWSYIAFKPGTVKAALDPDHVWFSIGQAQADRVGELKDTIAACKG